MRNAAGITVVVLLASGIAFFSLTRNGTDGSGSTSTATAIQAGSNVETVGAFPPAGIDHRAPVEPDTTSVDLCGYGPIQTKQGEDPFPANVRASAGKLLERVARQMSGSANPGDQAVAAYYLALTRHLQEHLSLPTRDPACYNDPACRQRFSTESWQVLAAAANEQASRVATTRDARAYATTWYLCQRVQSRDVAKGACAHVSAARWGELEPGNAMPWIIEAGRAHRADDWASYEAAMVQAGAATTSNLHWFEIYRMASQPLMQKADQATRLVALTDLVGIAASLPFPGLQHVTTRCKAPGISEEQRHQCQAIASAMSKGSTHMEALMGAGIGKAVGWSDADVAAIRNTSPAVYAARHTRVSPTDFYSCNALNMMSEMLPELAQLGELGAGELAIKRSGRTEKELLEDFRTGNKWARLPDK
jgi:hypothetical protein